MSRWRLYLSTLQLRWLSPSDLRFRRRQLLLRKATLMEVRARPAAFVVTNLMLDAIEAEFDRRRHRFNDRTGHVRVTGRGAFGGAIAMSESCDEYCTVHRHEIRKARKQHKCCACRAVIRPGDYYACVFSLFEGDVDTTKRCGSCERTWQHLKKLCDEHNKLNNDTKYPREDLSCGLSYEEEWEENGWGDLPDEIAALPLLSADERGALLKPAVKP